MRTLIAILLAGLLWMFLIHDSPPPADYGTLPRWSDRRGDANPLSVFGRELKSIKVPDHSRLAEKVREGEEGTAPALREFLDKQARAFAAFDKLIATPPDTWQWPHVEHVCDVSPAKDDAVDSLLDFGQLLRMRTALWRMEGRTEEAAKSALQGAKYGRGLQGSQGAVITHLCGVGIQRNCEAELKKILTARTARPGFLRACAHDLETVGAPERGDYQFVMRTDYLWLKNCLTQSSFSKRIEMVTSCLGWGNIEGFMMSPLFKLNRTLATRAALDWPVVCALESSWGAALSEARFSRRILDDFLAGKGEPSWYFDSNATGMLFLHCLKDYSGSRLERTMEDVMSHEQTRTMLALRLFELDEGTMPERLEELTPKYLSAVPEDIFGSGPMRWNAKSHTLYSVGRDGVDDGGRVRYECENVRLETDWGMRYWWSVASSVPHQP